MPFYALLLAVGLTLPAAQATPQAPPVSSTAPLGEAYFLFLQGHMLEGANDIDGAVKLCAQQRGSAANVIRAGLERYQQLKALEASIDEHPDAADLAEITNQLDRIGSEWDARLSRIKSIAERL